MAAENGTVDSTELDDPPVSMIDVLEEEHNLEQDANAVLGDCDDRNCTYPLGYVPRQALYACATCTPLATDPAGVCLACSLDCHESHELYELYTKRNFKCDCGNSKFPEKCKLYSEKDAVNIDNSYNQNFQGLYCTCSRPYPDPDQDTEDDMIQCVICEDWYHGRHLVAEIPGEDQYDEMMCLNCMKRVDFLQAYVVHGSAVKITETSETGDVEIEERSKNNKVTDENEDTDETRGNNFEVKQKLDENVDNVTKTLSTGDSDDYAANDGKNSGPKADAVGNENTDNDEVSYTLATAIDVAIEKALNKKTPENHKAVETNEKGTSQQQHVTADDQTAEDTCGNGTEDKNMAGNVVKKVIESAHGQVEPTETDNNGDVDESVSQTNVKHLSGDGDHEPEQAAESTCLLKELQLKREDKNGAHTVFWKAGWRKKLCTCAQCNEMYKTLKLEFLVDETDTMLAYEERGRSKLTPSTRYEKGMNVLSKLHRSQQIEVMSGYQDMKAELTDYLKKFSENGKVVREEDIKEFFTTLESRKRQRTSTVPQFYCK